MDESFTEKERIVISGNSFVHQGDWGYYMGPQGPQGAPWTIESNQRNGLPWREEWEVFKRLADPARVSIGHQG